MIQTKWIYTGVLWLFFTGNALAQELWETDIVVYFKPGILNLEKGVKTADMARLSGLKEESKMKLKKYKMKKLIRPLANAEPGQTSLTLPNGKTISILDRSRLVRLRFPGESDLEAITETLTGMPEVQYAHRIHPFKQLQNGLPVNDPKYYLQWNLDNTASVYQGSGTGDADIDAPEAWGIFTGSAAVIIGFLDTPVLNSHQDLTGKIQGGDSGVGNDHATFVAGIAAAGTNNGVGIAGVDWQARIRPIDLSGMDPIVIYDKMIAALNAGVTVFNSSIGDPNLTDVTIRLAYKAAYEGDAVHLVAMGNTGDGTIHYPAAYQDVMAVGSTDNKDERSTFSSTGNHIDVAAPGGYNEGSPFGIRDILSAGGNYDYHYRRWAGTSFATPHVSGIASLLRGYHPDLFNDDVMAIIKISADKIPDMQGASWTNKHGYGRVNAYEALKKLQAPYNDLLYGTATGGTSVSSTAWYSMEFPSRSLETGQAGWQVKKYDVQKTINYSQSYSWANTWGRKETIGFGPGENIGSIPDQYEEGWCEALTQNLSSTYLRTYVYKVRKINLLGQAYGEDFWLPTAPENAVFAYTTLGITDSNPPPDTPTGLEITNLGSILENPQLVWNASSGAASYNIYRCEGYYNPCTYQIVGSTASTSFIDVDVTITSEEMATGKYYYRVKAVNSGGESGFSNTVATWGESFLKERTTDDIHVNAFPQTYELIGNYPNPFNPTTVISIGLPEVSNYSIVIYDILGKEIKNWRSDNESPGYKQINWDGKNLNGIQVPAGIYIYVLNAQSNETNNSFIESKKMILLK